MALELGTVIDGKYELTGVLGQGGMGTVYAGRHQRIHRRVAIKVLKASVADDADIVRRFALEAQAAAQIGSSHIVEVYDVGELPSGEHFQILEYLDGESLSQRLKRVERMAPAEVFPLAMELLVGLSAAHQAGIVHRDLKPGNIYLAHTKDGEGEVVKILDFGISKFHYVDGDDATKTGTMVGTPHYMAPEQTRDASKADHRSDLYSVGAVLYRALAGRTPFLAKTIHELIAQLIIHDPPSLGQVVPDMDPKVVAIVHKALAREPIDRYQNARELNDDLGRWLEEAGLPLPATAMSGASWPRASVPGPPPPADSWPSDSSGAAAGPLELPTTPLHLTPVSYPGMPVAPVGAPPVLGGSGEHPDASFGQPLVPQFPRSTDNGPLSPTSPMPGSAGAPTPASLATPSPAFLDPNLMPPRRAQGMGLAIAGVAAVVVGTVIAALVLLSGTESAPSPTEPADTDVAARPSDDPADEDLSERPAEDGAESTAAPSAASATPPQASASTAPTKKPRPPTTRRPKPQPPTPVKPPKLGDRDYRTDL